MGDQAEPGATVVNYIRDALMRLLQSCPSVVGVHFFKARLNGIMVSLL